MKQWQFAQILAVYILVQNFDQPYGLGKAMAFAFISLAVCAWNKQ